MSYEILERAKAICNEYARTTMNNHRLLESLQIFERNTSAYRALSGASLREAINPPNTDHQVLGCADGIAFKPVISFAIYNINTSFVMTAAILAGLSSRAFPINQAFEALRNNNDDMLYYSIVLDGYISHAINLSKRDYLSKYIALVAAKKT